jgi:hypothetical protein
MASCLLLQADEAVWAADKSAEGKLKGLITAETQMIESKGVDPIRMRSYHGGRAWTVCGKIEHDAFIAELLSPVGKLSFEFASWTPQEQILLDIYGTEDGKKLIRDFEETLRGEERTILQHLPEFSNIPDPPEETAFDYIYHIAGTRSAHSRTSEFRTLAAHAIEVNRTHNNGLRWIAYGEHGATQDQFHVYLPFRKMATLDQWVDILDNRQISIVEGEAFTQTLRCGLTVYHTYVHVHVSACDHSG